MSEVLKLVPTVRLRRVVLAVAVSWVGGEYGRALFEVECDVALQTNRERAIDSGGEADGSAARGGRGLNRAVDGGRVERVAVAFGPERAHVEDARGVRLRVRNIHGLRSVSHRSNIDRGRAGGEGENERGGDAEKFVQSHRAHCLKGCYR